MNNEQLKYKPKFEVISGLIHLLYDLPDCGCGGLCHIVTDDDNVYDNNLKSVIDFCNLEENKDAIDKEISSLICSLMLELSFAERVVLFEVHMKYNGVDESLWKYYLKYDFNEDILKEYDYKHEFFTD